MKKTSTEEEIDEQLFTFKRLLIAGSNILVILKGGKRGFALENKRISDDETQIVRKMIEQGLTEEVCVMSDKKKLKNKTTEEQSGRIETEKREGVSILRDNISLFTGKWGRRICNICYCLNLKSTKSYVFPSKNQWNLCTHLKYWWLKLLRRKPTVCDGVDDQKEIQEVMDNTDESGGVIVLVRGEYVLHTGCEQKSQINEVIQAVGHLKCVDDEMPVLETLAPGECLIISKDEEGCLVACNKKGELALRKIKGGEKDE